MKKALIASALLGFSTLASAGVCHMESKVSIAIIHSIEPGKKCQPGDTLHIRGQPAWASRAAAMACKVGTISGPIGNRPEFVGNVCEFNGAPIRYDFYVRLQMGVIDEKGEVTPIPD